MKTMKVLVIGMVGVVAFGGGAFAQKPGPHPCRTAAERPIVQPDVRVTDSARSFGIKLDLISLAQARRPTKQVYREDAVALWRPATGQLVAQAGSGTPDINAAVRAQDVAVKKSMGEVVGSHFERRWKIWAGSAVTAAIGIPVGIKNGWFGNTSDDEKPKSTTTTTDTHAQTVDVTATAGNDSVITMIIYNGQPVAMPPE